MILATPRRPAEGVSRYAFKPKVTMANISSDTPTSTRPIDAPKRGTSKISLLLAFAAGAAASWIITESTDARPLDAPQAPTAIRR